MFCDKSILAYGDPKNQVTKTIFFTPLTRHFAT